MEATVGKPETAAASFCSSMFRVDIPSAASASAASTRSAFAVVPSTLTLSTANSEESRSQAK